MNENSNPAGNPVIAKLTNGTTVPSSAGIQQASIATHPEDDDDFERFEDLTRKLVQVPKSEVDEKRQTT